jgi:hypothetical protein
MRSVASRQAPSQFSYLAAVDSEPLKPAVRISITKAPPSWPKPCMAKTAPIMAPRHLVVANSDVMIEDSG